mmetsp:Transcript_27641/g.69687  ORF Transcript_27641/g.69687 Transcript_27641/m.69687 type:complete len:223 (+) Transcript_27641:597-1265(+)
MLGHAAELFLLHFLPHCVPPRHRLNFRRGAFLLPGLCRRAHPRLPLLFHRLSVRISPVHGLDFHDRRPLFRRLYLRPQTLFLLLPQRRALLFSALRGLDFRRRRLLPVDFRTRLPAPVRRLHPDRRLLLPAQRAARPLPPHARLNPRRGAVLAQFRDRRRTIRRFVFTLFFISGVFVFVLLHIREFVLPAQPRRRPHLPRAEFRVHAAPYLRVVLGALGSVA